MAQRSFFKHYSDMRHKEALNLIKEGGLIQYARLMITLEIISDHFSGSQKLNEIQVSDWELRSNLCMNRSNFGKFLESLKKIGIELTRTDYLVNFSTDSLKIFFRKYEKKAKEKREPKKELTNSKKILFNFQDGRFYNISNTLLEPWKEAYPAIDVTAEIRKAAAWLIANPKNKKKSYERFLNQWLSRAQDSAVKVGVFKKPTVAEQMREVYENNPFRRERLERETKGE